MLRVVFFLLVFVKFCPTIFFCEGSGRPSSMKFWEELVSYTMAADDKVASFCQSNHIGTIRELYSTNSFILTLSLPQCNIEELQIQTIHRVLYVKSGNKQYIRILANYFQNSAILWDYYNGYLVITMPYLQSLPAKTDGNCDEAIDTSVRNVPRVSSDKRNSYKSVADGSDSKDGKPYKAIAAGISGATIGGGESGGAAAGANAFADASDKAFARTASFASSYLGSNSTSKSESISSSRTSGDDKMSTAYSSSITNSYSSNDKGDVSSAQGSALATALNLGGANGIGLATGLALSKAYLKQANKTSNSVGAAASTALSVFGHKINVPLPKDGLKLGF